MIEDSMLHSLSAFGMHGDLQILVSLYPDSCVFLFSWQVVYGKENPYTSLVTSQESPIDELLLMVASLNLYSYPYYEEKVQHVCQLLRP